MMEWENVPVLKKNVRVLSLNGLAELQEALEQGMLKAGSLIQWMSPNNSSPTKPVPADNPPGQNSFSEVPKPPTQNSPPTETDMLSIKLEPPQYREEVFEGPEVRQAPQPTPSPNPEPASVPTPPQPPVASTLPNLAPQEKSFTISIKKPGLFGKLFGHKREKEERFKRLQMKGLQCYVCKMPNSEWGDQIEGFKTICSNCKAEIERRAGLVR